MDPSRLTLGIDWILDLPLWLQYLLVDPPRALTLNLIFLRPVILLLSYSSAINPLEPLRDAFSTTATLAFTYPEYTRTLLLGVLALWATFKFTLPTQAGLASAWDRLQAFSDKYSIIVFYLLSSSLISLILLMQSVSNTNIIHVLLYPIHGMLIPWLAGIPVSAEMGPIHNTFFFSAGMLAADFVLRYILPTRWSTSNGAITILKIVLSIMFVRIPRRINFLAFPLLRLALWEMPVFIFSTIPRFLMDVLQIPCAWLFSTFSIHSRHMFQYPIWMLLYWNLTTRYLPALLLPDPKYEWDFQRKNLWSALWTLGLWDFLGVIYGLVWIVQWEKNVTAAGHPEVQASLREGRTGAPIGALSRVAAYVDGFFSWGALDGDDEVVARAALTERFGASYITGRNGGKVAWGDYGKALWMGLVWIFWYAVLRKWDGCEAKRVWVWGYGLAAVWEVLAAVFPTSTLWGREAQ